MAITGSAAVVGVFREHALAEAAIHELQQAGFSNDQITLLHKGGNGNALGSLRNLFAVQPSPTTTQSADMLTNLNIPETAKDYYQREVDTGNTVLVVQDEQRLQEARTILYRHGAYNAETTPIEMGGTRIIPIRHEELQVNKQAIPLGEIRVHKRIITEQKTFTVPVTREELVIEHIPFAESSSSHVQVDQPGTLIERQQADVAQYQAPQASTAAPGNTLSDEVLQTGGTLRIVLHEDQVTISKQTVVAEEIVIRKDLIEETRQLTATAKHEEVQVVRHGNAIVHNAGIDIAEAQGINQAGI